MSMLVKQSLLSVAITLVAFWQPDFVLADGPERYTNDNFWSTPHEQPMTFMSDGFGGFYGYTVSGRLFEQKPILADRGVRLHRFQIEDAYFYISDRGVIRATDDLEALSHYLARAA